MKKTDLAILLMGFLFVACNKNKASIEIKPKQEVEENVVQLSAQELTSNVEDLNVSSKVKPYNEYIICLYDNSELSLYYPEAKTLNRFLTSGEVIRLKINKKGLIYKNKKYAFTKQILAEKQILIDSKSISSGLSPVLLIVTVDGKTNLGNAMQVISLLHNNLERHGIKTTSNVLGPYLNYGNVVNLPNETESMKEIELETKKPMERNNQSHK